MERNSIEISCAGLEDEQEIVPLMAAFNRSEGIVWRSESMVPALRRLLQEDDLGVVLVARGGESGVVVGYALATFGYDLEFAGRDAFITELFVAPPARGRGTGKGLLEAMVESLRKHDSKAVHLMVRPENARARSLYERLGFRVAPRIMLTRALPSDQA